LKENGVSSVFHYVPLHNSPAGLKYGKTFSELPVTEDLSERLLRLPLYFDLSESEVSFILEKLNLFFKEFSHEN
jgi:dTDP-4-amino-4,6-dideoxygalactose transaminase